MKIEGHEEILDYVMALAYLPEDQFQARVDNLGALIDEVTPVDDKLQRFYRYMRRQWVPLRKILSVYKRPIATNNICENYHRYLLKNLSKHTPLWEMLSTFIF